MRHSKLGIRVRVGETGMTVERTSEDRRVDHAKHLNEVEPFASQEEAEAHLNDPHIRTDPEYRDWVLTRAAKWYQQNNNQAALVNPDEAVSNNQEK